MNFGLNIVALSLLAFAFISNKFLNNVSTVSTPINSSSLLANERYNCFLPIILSSV